MWIKRLLLFTIVLAAYVQIMVNNPDQEIKKVGLQPALKIFARQIDYADHIEFIYQPGLRRLAVAKEGLAVKAVTPDTDNNYARIAEQLLVYDGFAITQCSAMDNWHTSTVGKAYLKKFYIKGYRAVVFDGGHHLPTLGLVPDIIIVPQMCGYTVHSYMRDGMKVEKLKALAEELDLPCVIAVLPRWTVFKEEQALKNVTEAIIAESVYSTKPARGLEITAEYHMSKYNNKILIYINQQYWEQRQLLLKRLKRLGTSDVDKIYLAFDYKQINIEQSQDFSDWLGEELKVAVETVNEPVCVFNAFWGDRSVLSK